MSRALRSLVGVTLVLCACGGSGESSSATDPHASTTVSLNGTRSELVGTFVSSLPALVPGQSLTLKKHAWTWVDEPQARCQHDDATGMFVNLDDPEKIVILLEPGAACFNAISCTASLAFHTLGASHASVSVSKLIYGINIFNRSDRANPVRSWSYVLFPYCSGDVFAGAARAGSGFDGRTQQGYYNVRAYLRRLIATFPQARKVLLAGSSAGGFGAAFNYDQVQEAFGQRARVYLLDDSGPPLPPEQMAPCLQERWRKVWNLDSVMPPARACPGCRNPHSDLGIMGMMEYLVTKYPGRRLAIISSTHDWIDRMFMGLGLDDCRALDPVLGLPAPMRLLPPDAYAAGLRELFLTMDSIDGATVRGFVVPKSMQHPFLVLPGALSTARVDGVTLGEWLRRLIEDDPAWDHVGLR